VTALVKKSFIAVVTILFLVSSVLAEMQVAKVAEANPIPYPSTPSTELPTLVVRSPKNYSDYYAENTFKLDFIIIKPESWNTYYNKMGIRFPIIGVCMFHVYLDGTPNRLLERFPRSDTATDYTAIFSNLTDTEHVVNIVVITGAYYESQYTEKNGEIITGGKTNDTYITQTMHFQIESNSKTVSFQEYPQVISRDPYPNPPTPIPLIISPQNTNYTTGNIAQFTLPLNFAFNATASWIGYSLDNQTRITINGNDTLSQLSIGSHNITLFASGIFGNMGISNTTNFTIAKQVVPNSGFQPIPLALPIVVFVVVLVVGVILHKRRKKVRDQP
jgi:hypothetical protein